MNQQEVEIIGVKSLQRTLCAGKNVCGIGDVMANLMFGFGARRNAAFRDNLKPLAQRGCLF